MSFREITFDNSGNLVFASDDSTLYDFLLDQPDGVIKGIHDELVTIQNGLDLEVSDGYAIILGRVLAVDKDTIEAVSIPVATGDEEGYLIIKIDLNQAEGSQASITYKKAASLPTLVQEDLLNDGMIYEYPLYTFTQTVVGITSITDVRTFLIPQNEVINAIPNNSVLSLIYVSNGKYSIDLGNNTFDDQNKLTFKFPSVDVDLESEVNIDVTDLNGITNYNVIVKDETGNIIENNYIQGQIADIYRESTNIVINRIEPIDALETEYNLPIQSQQTIVPVEGSPFNDNKVVGKSRIQSILNGDSGGTFTADASGTRFTIDPSGNIVNGNLFHPEPDAQVFKTDTTRKFLVVIHTDIANTLGGAVAIKYSDASEESSASAPDTNKMAIIIQPTKTLDFNVTFTEGSGLGLTTVERFMFIDITEDINAGMSNADIIASYSIYFESLKSVENPEIKIVNENVFDGLLESGSLSSSDGSEVIASTDIRTKNFISILSNTQYIFQYNGSGTGRIFYYDSNYNFISLQTTDVAFTTPSNARYLKARWTGDIEINQNIMLIFGNDNTVPFIKNDNSSKKYPNQILRDFPNGDADYIDTTNNILHVISKEYVITEDDITAFDNTSFTNDIAQTNTNFFADRFAWTDPLQGVTRVGISFEISNTGSAFNDVLLAGGYATVSNGTLVFSSLAGTWADLAAAKAALVGTIITYKIAIEIITKDIDVDGIAFAYKNMTVENIQLNGFSNSWFAKHALNDSATIQALGKALQTAEKQITKLEDETAANKAANEATQTDLDLAELTIIDLENDKVDKIVGKGLSENDYTDADKAAVTNNLVVEYDKVAITAGRFLSEDNIVAQTGNGWGAVFSADGDKLYILDSVTDTIYQYQTKEPFGEIDTFDTSKALGTSLGLRGMVIKEDGLKVIVSYINSTNIESFTLGTSNDISTLSLASKVQKDVSGVAPGGVRDIAISKDGSKFYYLEDGSDDTITYATLSAAWNILTLADVNSFDGSSIDLVIEGIAITELGGKMLVLGANSDTIYEIIMSTLFSFSGAVESPDSFLVPDNPVSISITHGSGVVLIADPGANSVKRYMFATASTKLTDALVSLAP